MVNLSIAALGLAVLLPLSAAAPAVSPSAPAVIPRDEGFSFEQWVEDILADPEGDHLSPEEAVKAAEKGTRSLTTENDLFKRDGIICDTKPPAWVPDAVACINQLAALGTVSCSAVFGGASNFCTIGNAQIVGITGVSPGTSSYCSDVARGAGAIMDSCTRTDNTVQGQGYASGNGDLAVHITAPEI